MKLNTAVIYGSVRGERRQDIKAARFFVRNLEQRAHSVTLIDPLKYKLPLLDLMYKEFDEGEAPAAMQEVGRILGKADGFIIVSAEYNHGEPAALKRAYPMNWLTRLPSCLLLLNVRLFRPSIPPCLST